MNEEGLRRRMKERLEALGVEVRELAERTEDPERTVHRWLSGESRMPAGFVLRFLREVPTSERWLFREEGSPEPSAPQAAEQAIEEVEAVLEKLRQRRREAGEHVTRAGEAISEALGESDQKRRVSGG